MWGIWQRKKLCKTKIIGFLLSLFLCIALFANEEEFKFKLISVDDGLSQTSVLTIFQDAKGFMWYGTRHGLNRYDGYSFKKFFHDPDNPNSLSSNQINNLIEDTKQRLWIGTAKGLNLYNWELDEFSRIQVQLNDIPVDFVESVVSIYEDRNGVIYVCTKKVIYLYDEVLQVLKRIDLNIELSNIRLVFQDFDNNFYIGSESNLVINSNSIDSIGYAKISAIHQFQEDTVWFGIPNFLVSYIPSQKRFIQYDIRNSLAGAEYITVRKIIDGQSEKLWLGTYYGVVIFNLKTKKFEKVLYHDINNNFSLSDNSITDLYKDKDGAYWVGTFSGGLNYLENEFISFKHYKQVPFAKNSINSNIISSVEEDKNGKLIIGTGRGGINVIDRTNNLLSFHYTKYNIRELLYDHKGNLYVGTFKEGLLKLDSNFNILKRFNSNPGGANLNHNFVFAVFEDSKLRLWVSTETGLNLLEPDSDTFQQYELDPDNSQPGIYEIFETTGGDIIIGSSTGVYKLNEETEIFDLLFKYDKNKPEQLPDININGIIEDKNNSWWIATLGGLVNYNPLTSSFIQYNIDNGLSGNAIFSVLEDENGIIWISTNKGINSINPQNGQIRKFDISNGLQGNEFRRNANYKCKTGELIFGGGNGFNIFHPDKITFNDKKPGVVFTDLLLANNRVSPGDQNSPLEKELIVTDKLVLNHTHNIFSIKYAALNYKSSHKNTYAYYLEGFENKWNYVGDQRIAKYTNLKPGDYTFRVKASNNDGVWNEIGSSIEIKVLPAFWQRLSFQILLGILFILVILLLIRLRLKKIQEQKNMLSKMVANRTRELEKANHKLEERQNILVEQKEELQSSKEEIISQRNQISIQLAEIENHRNNLEDLVQKRTRQLEEEKTKAQRADVLKTSFLANMSHEIRTPLNAIMGFSELLCDDDFDGTGKDEMKEIIRSNTDSLLHLIDDILDLSRIESNQLVLYKSDVNPDLLLDDLKNIFEQENRHSQKKDLHFKLSLDNKGENIKAYTDDTRLRQVLSNLLSNALKFSEKGQIELGYQIEDNFIKFFVRDSGIGIAADEKEVIFDRFRKLENQNKLYRGTGLGLSISKRIVELLGGKIGVNSEVGVGSEFYFTIPYQKKSESIIPVKIQKHNKNSNWENHNILIAEDDDTNFNLLRFVLKKTGANILWGKNGDEAFDLYKKNKNISVILMDLKMPKSDGYEALRLIKSLDRDTPPIIAQTAHVMASEKEKIRKTGFDDYISKPINKSQLISILGKYLNK